MTNNIRTITTITPSGKLEKFLSLRDITEEFVDKLSPHFQDINRNDDLLLSIKIFDKNDADVNNIFLFSNRKNQNKVFTRNLNFYLVRNEDKNYFILPKGVKYHNNIEEKTKITVSNSNIYLPSEKEFLFWEKNISELENEYEVRILRDTGNNFQSNMLSEYPSVETKEEYNQACNILYNNCYRISLLNIHDSQFKESVVNYMNGKENVKQHIGLSLLENEYEMFVDKSINYMKRNNIPKKYIPTLKTVIQTIDRNSRGRGI